METIEGYTGTSLSVMYDRGRGLLFMLQCTRLVLIEASSAQTLYNWIWNMA